MFKIAIDGPAGSGKSTISKLLAKKLNFEYIDTGAMYRAVTLKGLRLGINLENEAEYDYLDTTVLDICNGRYLMDGEDVSEAIRSIDVTNNVSAVSSYEGVREEMVNLQKEYGKKGGIVMDGRDIGTTVFPNAELKIFQIASVEERANRRYKENMRKGIACDLNTLKEEIKVRDFKDSTRSVSPLRKASDAIELDTSNLEPNEVVDKIVELAKKIIESEE